MTDTWRWNDATIGNEQQVYRHVPKAPGPKKRLDPLTGEWSLTLAAFTVEEMREDGWSIYRDELLKLNQLTVASIEGSAAEPREVWELTAGDARAEEKSGIIDEMDRNGGTLGLAHGLIRFDVPKPDKERIRRLRTWLIEHARRG